LRPTERWTAPCTGEFTMPTIADVQKLIIEKKKSLASAMDKVKDCEKELKVLLKRQE
jgi:hypothetical protein